MGMNEEEESEDEFFDEFDHAMEDTVSDSVMMDVGQDERREIGKDEYGKENAHCFGPIRPSNVSIEQSENECESEQKSNSPINKLKEGEFERKFGYQNEQIAESSADEIEF